MKAVFFAGGVGTRLWPLSRKKSPKQFEKIIGNQSTLQLGVTRLLKVLSPQDIYVSTGKQYFELVSQQLPEIPAQNIIAEPEKKDNGPAVGVVVSLLARQFPDEAVAILWADHLVKEGAKFSEMLLSAAKVAEREQDKLVFIGQKPRFASENLGWIDTGKEITSEHDFSFRSFEGFKYKPDKELAEKYFADSRYCWNLGYFVSTARFLDSLFLRYSPQIHTVAQKISAKGPGETFQKLINEYYAEMPEITFDNAVHEQLDHSSALVVVDDIGWSDVGAWEALKEALEEHPHDNVTKGEILLEDCKDNLIYNYDEGKLVVGIDLEESLVINTKDVLLVTKKSSVSKIKKLVERLKGTDLEKLT